MVRYTCATLALLLAMVPSSEGSSLSSIPAFVGSNHNGRTLQTHSRRYSAVPYDDRLPSGSSSSDPLAAMQGAQSQEQGIEFSNPVASLLEGGDDDDAEVDALLAKKEARRAARQRSQKSRVSPVYRVTLPIVASVPTAAAKEGKASAPGGVSESERLASLVAKGQEIAVASTLGLSLRQVYSGRQLSELALDVDTLRFQSFRDELQGRTTESLEIAVAADVAATNGVANGGASSDDVDISSSSSSSGVGSVQLLQNEALALFGETFDGVVVSSVARGGLAWNAGVRAGDSLVATSATIGNKLWPKSTLDGVRSSISSRKVMSKSMDFEFRRLEGIDENDESEAVDAFELSLTRPIGINVEDTDDGYVTITGMSANAPPTVLDNLRVGDRITAVQSAFGGNMWPVSNADGLTSAVISRLPKFPVRISFERVVEAVATPTIDELGETTEDMPKVGQAGGAVSGFRTEMEPTVASSAAATTAAPRRATTLATTSPAHKLLLSRSRDLLRTYIARNNATKERAIPAKVADRVLEAVMESSATLDGKTLALVMNAYNACDKPDEAIRTFEAAFGLAGDGSETEPRDIFDGRLTADASALSAYTASALLRAHAAKGDHVAARQVLSAMDCGQGPYDDECLITNAMSWEGKGDPFGLVPDARCFNIALNAAARSGTKEGIAAAMEIFDSMPDPTSVGKKELSRGSGPPEKDLVTYNTLIAAFASSGMIEDADVVFKSMKKAGVRPDKFTFTTLIKASIKGGDSVHAMEILDDMIWIGIKPDIVTYNTMIESLCNTNQLYEAKDLVIEMENTRVSPDSMTYGLLMKGLLKADKPGPCLTLFETACADDRTTVLTENVQLYTTAITAASAIGDHERALELVTRMNRAGVKPNQKTLTALMGACISGGEYESAADVFSKIKNPDNYAISVGLRALCGVGSFDEAMSLLLEQRSGQMKLSGKEVMIGYNNLISSVLMAGEFSLARQAMTDLLQGGYIPSKQTFAAITEGLNLQRKSEPLLLEEKFDYFLFLLDILEKRKLTVDAVFYSSILELGSQTGGLRKRISAFIAESRRSGFQQEMDAPGLTKSSESPLSLITWEDLLANYSDYKQRIGSDVRLPTVRISSREFSRVLAAEQALSYGRR